MIPYTNIDEMEIDNGKVYTMKDFSDIMNQTVEEPVGMEKGGTAVGIYHSDKKMIVFSFIVVIIFNVFCVWKCKKNKLKRDKDIMVFKEIV